MTSIHPNPTTRLVIQIECSPLYIAVWNSFQTASNQNFCHQDTQLHTLVNCRMNCTKLIGREGNVTIPVKESQQGDDYKEMQWIPTMSRKNRKDVDPPNECVILPSPAQKDIPSQALCERRRGIKKEWCMIHANNVLLWPSVYVAVVFHSAWGLTASFNTVCTSLSSTWYSQLTVHELCLDVRLVRSARIADRS